MDKTLQKIIKIIGIIIICYLIYLLYPGIKTIIYWLIKIFIPFIIGFVGAYLLLPIVNKLINHASLELSQLIYYELASTGIGQISNSPSGDIEYQLNYLLSLRQKSSSNKFFNLSIILYT